MPDERTLLRLLRRRLSRRDALRIAVLGSAGAGLALAGCGGGDDEPPAPTPTLVPGASPAPGAVAPTAEPGGWRRIDVQGPPGRHDHSLAYDEAGGTLWLFAGRVGGAPINDLWAFDVAAQEWRAVATIGTPPSARFGHNSVFDPLRGRLLIYGGQLGGTFFDDLHAYVPGENSWGPLSEGEGPAARYGAGGALDEAAGRFYVTHGFTFQGRFDDSWALDLAADAWGDVSPAAGRPIPRCLLRSVWDPEGNALILFGGQSNEASFHDDTWHFSPSAGSWTEAVLDTRPSARNLYAAVFDTSGGRMILIGGKTADGDANDVWAYSPKDGAWTQLDLPPGPSSRNSHDAVYLPDRNSILLFGGAGAEGELDDLWELSLTGV